MDAIATALPFFALVLGNAKLKFSEILCTNVRKKICKKLGVGQSKCHGDSLSFVRSHTTLYGLSPILSFVNISLLIHLRLWYPISPTFTVKWKMAVFCHGIQQWALGL